MDLIWLSFFSNAVGAAFGALAGATGAFWLEVARQRREKKRKNVGAANRALFVASQYLNELVQYRRDYVRPAKAGITSGEHLRPVRPRSVLRPSIDLDSLAFLNEIGSEQLLFNLFIEQQRVVQLFDSIEDYSRTHVLEIQPKLAAADVPSGADMTKDDFVRLVGADLVGRLESDNKYVMDNIDENIRSLKATMNELQVKIGSTYKKAVVLQIELEK